MILPEERWIEISRMFIDAYSQFHSEGKVTSWLKLNNRDIEISFLPSDNIDSDLIRVMLYCPEIETILEAYFNLATHDTEEIITMLYKLAKKPRFFDITKINTNDSEEEYEIIKETLVSAYKNGHFTSASEAWEKEGTEIRIIELHGKVFKVIFAPHDDGLISVYINCDTTNISCTRIISIEEKNPRNIIRLIQNLAWDNA